MNIIQDPLTIKSIITKNCKDSCESEYMVIDDDDLCAEHIKGLTICKTGYSSD